METFGIVRVSAGLTHWIHIVWLSVSLKVLKPLYNNDVVSCMLQWNSILLGPRAHTSACIFYFASESEIGTLLILKISPM